jgi:hypothetical protein
VLIKVFAAAPPALQERNNHEALTSADSSVVKLIDDLIFGGCEES